MTTDVDLSAPGVEGRGLSPNDTRRDGDFLETLHAFCKAMKAFIPEGYQDETGFHFGAEEPPQKK